MFLLLFGAPGVGKGTQARRLTEALGLPHLSTGEILRRAIEEDTPLGHQASEFMHRGKLVPDDLVVGMVGEQLALPEYAHGCLLDGFPRTQAQAQALDLLLRGRNQQVDLVLKFEVPKEQLVERMTQRAEVEGRSDDTPETIAHRFEVYENETAPVLDYYRHKDIVRTIDGAASPDEVHREIMSIVSTIQS